MFSHPPSTNIKNLLNIVHINDLFAWFISNDRQLSLLESDSIYQLFVTNKKSLNIFSNINHEEYVKIISKLIEKCVGDNKVRQYIVASLYVNMIIRFKSDYRSLSVRTILEKLIDFLDELGNRSLITCGDIMIKYKIDPIVKNLDLEISKINNPNDVKLFKENYLKDVLISSQVRILVWMYKDMFNVDYKAKRYV